MNLYNQLILHYESENPKNKIIAQKAKLIPIYKVGDEKSLTSIFLSSLNLINEFRSMIFKEIGLRNSNKIHFFTEIEFIVDDKKLIPDGLILIEKAGKIIDSAFFEMKNGKNDLKAEQIENYLELCSQYGIKKLVTVSNQYVTNSSDTPIGIKKLKQDVRLLHLSWSLILTLSNILLYKEKRIDDPDQVRIMQEVVDYMEHKDSGILGFTKMKPGWKKLTKRIQQHDNIKDTDNDVLESVESWIQEEKDMALILSRKMGKLVKINMSKNDLLTNRYSNCSIESNFKIKNLKSMFNVRVNFSTTSIYISYTLPFTAAIKTLKGQLGFIKKQIANIERRNEKDYMQIKNQLSVILNFPRESNHYRSSLEFDDFLTDHKDKKLRKYGFMLQLKFSVKDFSEGKKLIHQTEKKMITFWDAILSNYLTKN